MSSTRSRQVDSATCTRSSSSTSRTATSLTDLRREPCPHGHPGEPDVAQDCDLVGQRLDCGFEVFEQLSRRAAPHEVHVRLLQRLARPRASAGCPRRASGASRRRRAGGRRELAERPGAGAQAPVQQRNHVAAIGEERVFEAGDCVIGGTLLRRRRSGRWPRGRADPRAPPRSAATGRTSPTAGTASRELERAGAGDGVDERPERVDQGQPSPTARGTRPPTARATPRGRVSLLPTAGRSARGGRRIGEHFGSSRDDEPGVHAALARAQPAPELTRRIRGSERRPRGVHRHGELDMEPPQLADRDRPLPRPDEEPPQLSTGLEHPLRPGVPLLWPRTSAVRAGCAASRRTGRAPAVCSRVRLPSPGRLPAWRARPMPRHAPGWRRGSPVPLPGFGRAAPLGPATRLSRSRRRCEPGGLAAGGVGVEVGEQVPVSADDPIAQAEDAGSNRRIVVPGGRERDLAEDGRGRGRPRRSPRRSAGGRPRSPPPDRAPSSGFGGPITMATSTFPTMTIRKSRPSSGLPPPPSRPARD